MTRRNLGRYSQPVHEFDSLEAFLDTPTPTGISAITQGGLPLDIMVLPKPGASTILFAFHGAAPTGATTPIFTGLEVSQQTQAHRVFLSDPSLELDADLHLAWFAGNSRQRLSEAFPLITAHVAAQLGARRQVFYGGSGGGFAALRYSALAPGSLAIAVNPQTSVCRYGPGAVQKYLEVCWGINAPGDLNAACDAVGGLDLCTLYARGTENTVAYAQTARDWHVNRHMRPFLEAASANCDIWTLMSDWGPGHSPAPKSFTRALLNATTAATASWTEALSDLGFGRAAQDTAGQGHPDRCNSVTQPNP